MSEWLERFRASPIWKAMDDLGPAIDSATTRDEIEPESLEALARLRTALTFIGKRLAAADPLLIQPGPIDNAGSYFANATSEVQQFTANGSQGHLTNANSHLDSALALIAQLNVPLGPADLQALKEPLIAIARLLKPTRGRSRPLSHPSRRRRRSSASS